MPPRWASPIYWIQHDGGGILESRWFGYTGSSDYHLQTGQSEIGRGPMPKGSKVDKVYQALRKDGASPGKAARIAQSQTGKSLKTGRKRKGKK